MPDGRTSVRDTEPAVYSVALEQQARLVRALVSPNGGSLVAGDLFGALGDKLSQAGLTLGRIAQLAGLGLSEATPFLWAGHIAQTIREATRTMPAYTFAAESFPCPWGFSWFDEPVSLLDDADGAQVLRALNWQVRPANAGKVPVGINGFLTAPTSVGVQFAGRPIRR